MVRINIRPGLMVVFLLLTVAVAGCSKKMTAKSEVPVPEALPADTMVLNHTVGPGETLALIADNYYGDPDRRDDIARDNGLADPDRIVPGSMLQLRFNEGEWDAARRRAEALVPYNKGVEAMGREMLGEAEKQFRSALQIAPDLAAARYNLALVLLKRGHTESALELLEQLTTDRPLDKDFRFARGNALFQAARFEAAAEQFEAALERDPRFKRAAYGLARSLQEAGLTDRAIAAWQAYLVLDDTSSWAAAARRNLKTLQEPGDS
jgi:tetratricopeptide (TPR) repeat protein